LRRKVAIPGAIGAVGQRSVQLLEGHPWFETAVLAASERSAGRRYREDCGGRLETEMPLQFGDVRKREFFGLNGHDMCRRSRKWL